VIPDISVVVSTRNRGWQLSRLLAALLTGQNASRINHEVIVVDNGSTDDTARIVGSWSRRFRMRLRPLFEPRRGVSYGRNAGIAAARAPIVAFTDDDNEPSSDWVATAVRLFREDPALELCGGKLIGHWSAPPPRWLDRRHWAPLAIMDYGDEPFWTSAERPVCFLTSNLVVRRHVFERLGGFSPQFPRCQDHEWMLRFWECGGRGLYAPDLVVVAPVTPERMTKRYHRRWHRQHGRAAGRMRLQERVSAQGHLVAEPSSSISIAGAPAFIYRELAATGMSWIRASWRRDWSGVFEASNHLRYLSEYLVERAGGGISLSQLAADLARWATTRRCARDTSIPSAAIGAVSSFSDAVSLSALRTRGATDLALTQAARVAPDEADPQPILVGPGSFRDARRIAK
jgi:glycosyltransferase involved in cell wall biosynthesis